MQIRVNYLKTRIYLYNIKWSSECVLNIEHNWAMNYKTFKNLAHRNYSDHDFLSFCFI